MIDIIPRIDQFIVRRKWACLLALMALTAGAYSVSFKAFWNPSADGTGYLLVGRYLAEGKDIRELEAVPFPPLVGAYLAAGYLMPGRPWVNHQIQQLATYLAMVAATYALIRRLAGPTAGLLVAALTGLNCDFISWSSRYQSEATYTALSMAALWAGASVFRQGRLNWRAVAAMAFLSAMAVMTRTIGLVLAPAALALLISRDGAGVGRLKRLAAAGVVIAACAVPQAWWAHWSGGASRPRAYAADLMGGGTADAKPLIEDMPNRVATYGWNRIETLFPAMVTPAHAMASGKHTWLGPKYLLYLTWAALVCYGWWRQFRSRRSVVEAYSLLYAGVLSVWPYVEGNRFMLPLVPLGWYYVITVFRDVAGRWRWPAWPALACAAVLVCAAVATCIYDGYRRQRSFEATADMRDDILAVGGYVAGRRDVPDQKILVAARTRSASLALLVAAGRVLPIPPYGHESDNGPERRWPAGKRLVVLETAVPEGWRWPTTAPEDDRSLGAQDKWRLVMRSGGLQVYERAGDTPRPPGWTEPPAR